MPILIRVDIDKPFGHHTFFRKVISKVKEDYSLPNIFGSLYLTHYKEFLRHCNENGARAHLYHRLCTVPDKETTQLIKDGGHHYGFHAENTRSLETFSNELQEFKNKSIGLEVKSFSKHGSGVHKLGKNHYPKFEPEKYKEWAKEINIFYPFGNEIAKTQQELLPQNGWYTGQFWLEHNYREGELKNLDQLIEAAKTNTVVALIHPSNYITHPEVKKDFQQMIVKAKEEGISFNLINE